MYQRIPPRPYRGYGQSKHRKRFVLLAVFLGLCLLAFSAFFILQDYLVFSSDGVRLELPFSLSKKISNKAGDPVTPPLEIEPQESAQEGTQAPPDNTVTPPEKVLVPATVLHAVYADVSKLSDSGYRKNLLALPDLNAVVIDLKLPDGSITYRSKAAAGGASDKASDAVSEAVKEFSDNGIYIIGRMSAFRDNIAPRTEMRAAAVKTKSEAVWLDYKSISWFNPYEAGTGQYLAALALEASDMGVDELQLYNLCFPVSGKIGLISYSDTGDRTATVNAILKEVSTALDGSKMVLSVMPEDSALATGKDLNAGQDIAEFSKTGRIYFNVSGSASTALFDSVKWDQIASGAFDAGEIVPVLKTIAEDKPLAALPQEPLEKCGYVLMNESGEYTPQNFVE